MIPMARARSMAGNQRRHADANIRKEARLSGAEEKACEQEHVIVGGHPGEGGEGRPPQDDACQHAAGADAVAQPPGGNLEDGIRNREDAHDPAPPLGADVQAVLYARPGN
jgi:hypothetical protein